MERAPEDDSEKRGLFPAYAKGKALMPKAIYSRGRGAGRRPGHQSLPSPEGEHSQPLPAITANAFISGRPQAALGRTELEGVGSSRGGVTGTSA